MTSLPRRGDARLVVPAAAAWAAAAALVTGTSYRAGLVAVTAAAVVVMCALPRRWVVAGAALGVAAGAASTAVHVAAIRNGPVAQAAAHRQHAQLLVRLVRDPVAVHSRHGRRLVVADASVTSMESTHGRWAVNAPVVLFSLDPRWLGLLPGQRVRVDARLVPPRGSDPVSAVAFAAGAPRLVGRPPPWQRVAGRIRAALREACAGLPADERGLVPGLVIGDVSAMPADLTTDFRVTGLTHLNAVSGANVAIVLGTVTAVVRRLGAGRRSRSVLAAAALVGYVVLVRPSPSVLRAGVMGAVAIAATLAGRPTRSVPVLSAAVLGLVVVDPFLARSAGFALSVLATFAIVTLAPRLTTALARHVRRPVAAAVAVPTAAQLACTPVIVAAFGQLTPLAVPANLLAAPVVAPATLAGVAAALTAVPMPGVARVLAWVAAAPAGWLAAVARTLAAAPGAGLTWPRGAAGVALLCPMAAGVAVARWWLVRRQTRRHGHGMLGTWRR